MILCHVTDGVAMVGDGGSLAAPMPGRSRLTASCPPTKATTMTCYGCRSCRASLTADPDMPDDFCTRHGFRSASLSRALTAGSFIGRSTGASMALARSSRL